jgi:hypothetical protein
MESEMLPIDQVFRTVRLDRAIARSAMASKAIEHLPAVNKDKYE